MLAKMLGILLGILGVTTTAVNFPAQPTTVAIKTATTTGIANTKDKSDDFSLLKSSEAVKKVATTTQKISSKETQTKKPTSKTEEKPAEKIEPPAVAPTAPEAPRLATTTISSPPVDWSAINQKARQAIVNIICTSLSGGSLEPLSGSGVIIDPRGIILTNAHIAQYFLLQDYQTKNFLTCVARAGSPATPVYRLKLLYISKPWVENNYKKIVLQNPTGTGENDFALLQITGPTNPEVTLSSSIPFIPIDSNDNIIDTGEPVVLASYPAGFLGGIAIQRDLYAVSTIVQIGKLFTFKTGSLDLFSLGGSPVAQHGSSGGAVVSVGTKLIGIIVTSTNATDTSNRDLEALSIGHVDRELNTQIGMTLNSFLTSDLEKFSKQFDTDTLPGLKKLLIDKLESRN